jgi:hypothetical protein
MDPLFPMYCTQCQMVQTPILGLGGTIKAIHRYQEAWRLDPNDAVAHSNLACLLATSEDAQFRDPHGALEHAQRMENPWTKSPKEPASLGRGGGGVQTDWQPMAQELGQRHVYKKTRSCRRVFGEEFWGFGAIQSSVFFPYN